MKNKEIKAYVVRLIKENGKEIIDITLDEAIRLAEKTGEDVVCISNNNGLPIVKIMDYNKFIYEKQKKDKENKKKQRLAAQDIKEIQISDVIAEHDLKIKANKADKMLKDGSKVRLTIKYRGRSIKFIYNGATKLQELANMLTVNYKIDSVPKIESTKVSMLISPIHKVK